MCYVLCESLSELRSGRGSMTMTLERPLPIVPLSMYGFYSYS
jgi:hypothetical protein